MTNITEINPKHDRITDKNLPGLKQCLDDVEVPTQSLDERVKDLQVKENEETSGKNIEKLENRFRQ